MSTEWIVLVWFIKYVVTITLKKINLRTDKQIDS